ncbi:MULTISPECIES: esterase-like activity of phytase family protein [unclassified Phyllobacterium]|uniref:esterase-like activity of phytase family protein n=1 Tax=unclassified Phyllobacterium TaxID=2638441 RepID=UPI0030131832
MNAQKNYFPVRRRWAQVIKPLVRAFTEYLPIRRFQATATFLLISSSAVVHATEIGTTIETPCPYGDCSAGISLSYLGEFVIPTGKTANGIEFGGISGLDFDASTGRYIGLSDDRAERGPVRFYELDIDISAGSLKEITVVRHVDLLDKNGEPIGIHTADPEALRIGNDGIYWSSEGDGKTLAAPFVRVGKPDGSFLREFRLPDDFTPTADQSSGIRDNLAFESLAISPSGEVFAGVEGALYQDGPVTSLTIGGLARIIRYNGSTGEPKAQYLYPVSPIPQAAVKAEGDADNGLVEMAALDNRRLLALERSFSQGFGNHIKLFMIDLDGATDIADIASLARYDQRVVPIRKSQILDLRAIGLMPDNIEAMAIGKTKDGTDVLILGADNNFSSRQKTQFFAFKINRRPGT